MPISAIVRTDRLQEGSVDHINILKGLLFIASAVTATAVEDFIQLSEHAEWDEEGEELRFRSLNDAPYISSLRVEMDQLTGNRMSDFIADVDINLIEVIGKVPAHHHAGSDVVMRCVQADNNSLVLTDPLGFPVWQQTGRNDLLVFPRGSVHGFRASRPGLFHRRFLFVDFNYPPLGEEDVVLRPEAE